MLSNFCSHPGAVATLSIGLFIVAERAKNGYSVFFEDIRIMLYVASVLGFFAGLIWGWITGLIVFGVVNLIIFAILIWLDAVLDDEEEYYDIF